MTAAIARHRVLISGGDGFVGRRLTSYLTETLAPGSEVLGSGLSAPAGGVAIDIRDRSQVGRLVESFRPTAVVHLAGVSHWSDAADDEARAWDVNLFGALNVAHTLLATSPECQLLHVSTSEVYGGGAPGEAFNEGHPLDPRNTYSATKAAADLAIGALAHHGLRCVRFRPFNHTGPGQSDQRVIARIASQLAWAEAHPQDRSLRLGDLTPIRDFLDVDDVCRAYRLAIENPDRLPFGVVLNLASGHPRSIQEVVDTMLRLGDVRPDVISYTGTRSATDVAYACGDARRARDLLGWTPEIPWEQTLAAVLKDWRARVATGWRPHQ